MVLCIVALVVSAALRPPLLQAAGSSLLWKATNSRGGVIYLAGSIHLLNDEYYPLAPAFEHAFAESDLLVEEIDIGDMQAPEAQMLMLTRGMMPAGKTLESVVSPETMDAVRAKVAELGLPIAPLQLFKPWALALTLQGLEWQKAGLDPNLGLDKHFYDRAKAAGRPVQGLETVEFQIGQFDGLPMPLQDRMLASTLKEMASTADSVNTLAKAWKGGDASAIESMVLRDLRTEPEMYRRLLVDRNNAWLPKIQALFTRQKPSLVVVGAAHLVGSDGLVAMLTARGHKVEQL